MRVGRHDLGSEVPKEKVLGNFRDPNWRLKRGPRWQDKRPGVDPEHVANLSQLPCPTCSTRKFKVVCHHLRYGSAVGQRGVGFKATDMWGVPLCWSCHSDLHRYGSRKEQQWWAERGYDGEALARGLWNARGDKQRLGRVLLAHQLAAVHARQLKIGTAKAEA